MSLPDNNNYLYFRENFLPDIPVKRPRTIVSFAGYSATFSKFSERHRTISMLSNEKVKQN